MTFKEKTKTVSNKFEQNKAQYYLYRQPAKISALLSVKVSNYDFFTGEDFYPRKDC